MTVTDPDILAVARSLVRRYGDEAKRHALKRISELIDDGDVLGRDLWGQVADAVDEIQGAARGSGEAVH